MHLLLKYTNSPSLMVLSCVRWRAPWDPTVTHRETTCWWTVLAPLPVPLPLCRPQDRTALWVHPKPHHFPCMLKWCHFRQSMCLLLCTVSSRLFGKDQVALQVQSGLQQSMVSWRRSVERRRCVDRETVSIWECCFPFPSLYVARRGLYGLTVNSPQW